MLGCSIFNVGSAAAKDIQTLIICRFFAGVFGASPLCVVPAVLADVYTNVHRGVAISIYALTVFGGPLFAPFIGGFMSMAIGWRWTLWLVSILGFLDVCLLLVWLDETYHPIILANKARVIRHQTGNWGIHARHETIEVDFHEVSRKYFTRPLRMLITEPIVLAVTLYMSFIYGLVYALLEAYPYVFENIYEMNSGVAGLPFLGLFIGIVVAIVFILSQQGSYVKKLKANQGVPVPEWRLMPVTVGAFAFTMGLFW
jgi:DHA1 family multidrug resistance protein-like MFS transporter